MASLVQDVWLGWEPRLRALRLAPWDEPRVRVVFHLDAGGTLDDGRLGAFLRAMAEGLEVITWEPRGQGASGGRFGPEVLDDARRLVSESTLRWGPLPLVVGGHGLGGWLALALAGAPGVAAAFALAPSLAGAGRGAVVAPADRARPRVRAADPGGAHARRGGARAARGGGRGRLAVAHPRLPRLPGPGGGQRRRGVPASVARDGGGVGPGGRGTRPVIGRPQARLLLPIAVLLALLAAGTVGYQLVEGWGWFDALYMTAITITTVGFLEVHPMGAGGRVFTMALALGGVFTAFYAAAEFIRALVTGEIGTILGRQRMETRLEKLDGHFVVCGFGRMGRLVAEEFSSAGLPFVVVDRDEKVLVGFDIPHGIPLVGDATADDVLRRAGVERARALVTAAASDADNVFITMSARLLNEKLVIVARAEGEGAEVKLRRAGASRVVSPYSIGGHRVAQAVLRPNAMDFIELATRTGHLELQIEEVEVRPQSALVGRSVKASPIRSELGIIIVAIKKPQGKMAFNPAPEAVLEAGDLLITLGHRQQLDRLEAMATGA